MLILRPEFDPKDTKKIEELVKKLSSGSQVKEMETNVLGKKMLAYPIKKQKEGVYVLVKLSGDSIKSAILENQAKLMPEVLRLMLVVED